MIQTKKEFQQIIDRIVTDLHISYFDALIHYLRKNELEPEDITGLISNQLKSLVYADAMELNFFPKKQKLPVE